MAWQSEIKWDEQGRPYRTVTQTQSIATGAGGRTYGRSANVGERIYVSPSEVSQNPTFQPDERLRTWAAANPIPGGSLLRDMGTFDSRTGNVKRGINWSNIASMGIGAYIAAPWVAKLGVSHLISGLGKKAAVEGVRQAVTPAVTQAATQATPAFLGAASTIPAWVNPAIQAAAAGTPAVANLFARPNPVSGPVGTTTPQSGQMQPPPQVNLNATNGYRIPGVGTISGRDIIDYGVGITQWLLNRRQNNQISDAQLRAAQDALDWAKEQYRLDTARDDKRYEEARALEQRRYDEYNARRAPYREASLASLAELRKLIGI